MGTKRHVLVVDDSLTVRMDLRAALSNAGFAVTACSTKESGLQALEASSFDLAILDILLPDGSGIDILQHIKQNPALRAMHVFMLSTEAEVQSRLAGLRLGADQYVGKPYDRGYLARAARTLFKMADYAGPPTSRRSLSNKKILLVDDSPTFLHALSAVLRQEGHQIVAAYSGADALALLELERFDCVVLDLVMPGVDGLQTCRRLRELPQMLDVPIALMTATPDASLKAEAVSAGADDVLLKPTNLALMAEELRALLIKKQRHAHPADESGHSEAAT